jgi:hypothetical protein
LAGAKVRWQAVHDTPPSIAAPVRRCGGPVLNAIMVTGKTSAAVKVSLRAVDRITYPSSAQRTL